MHSQEYDLGRQRLDTVPIQLGQATDERQHKQMKALDGVHCVKHVGTRTENQLMNKTYSTMLLRSWFSSAP